MKTTTSLRFKNLLGFALLVGLLTSVSVTFTNCGGNDDDPDPKDTTTTTSKFKAEYLKVDGKVYDANQISTKSFQDNNREDIFKFRFNSQYPAIIITHERANGGSGDTLVPRAYDPVFGTSTSEDFGYEVDLHYAEGSPPNYCQFHPEFDPKSKNGTYQLLKIDGKYVSEFSNVKLYCKNNGIYTDSIVVEGYLIWEEK